VRICRRLAMCEHNEAYPLGMVLLYVVARLDMLPCSKAYYIILVMRANRTSLMAFAIIVGSSHLVDITVSMEKFW
jgi:hypothetical protein